MRSKLGILLVEDECGQVSVQLFADGKGVEDAFNNLTGRVGDPPSRATLLMVDYLSENSTRVSVKMLPVVVPVEEIPDGFVLGSGPVKFPNEEG